MSTVAHYDYQSIEQVRHALALLPEEIRPVIDPGHKGTGRYRLAYDGHVQYLLTLSGVEIYLRQRFKKQCSVLQEPQRDWCRESGFAWYSMTLYLKPKDDKPEHMGVAAYQPTPLHALCLAYAVAWEGQRK